MDALASFRALHALSEELKGARQAVVLAVVALRLMAIAFDLQRSSITGHQPSWAGFWPRTFRVLQLSHTRFLGTALILA